MENEELNTIVENEKLEVVPQKPTPNKLTMWNDWEGEFAKTGQIAKFFAQSDLLPQAYKGKPANVMIAMDIANQLGISPMTVMQNSQVVQGKFGWTGSACKALIDGCGIYEPTTYVEVGERDTDSWGFYLLAHRISDGAIIKGITVTIGMAKKEGWYNKSGSKWQTMPELMLKYRAAAFFMRTECASIAMGFLTAEELQDIAPEKRKDGLQSAIEDEEE